MIIQEILVANGASVMLLVILLISRYMTRRVRDINDRVFTALIFIGLAGSVLEAVSFLVDGRADTVWRLFNVIDNSLLYICTASVSVLWVWYVDLHLNHNAKRLKTIYSPLLVVWAVLIGLSIGNAFANVLTDHGFLFTVGAANVYAREALGYSYYAFLLTAYIISIVLYIQFRRKHGEAQFFPIWMFLTPLFIACLVQIPFYGISVAWIGFAIGLTGIYLNLQSKQSLVDSLTGLYNRAYIEHKLIVARQNQRYVYSGIMLDIDRFKVINDTYGHSVGDNALINVAKILTAASDRDSLVFRFAGDEFIMLVRTEADNAQSLEAQTLVLEDRIRAEAEKFNSESGAPYKIVFSMGHAVYDTERPDDDFFHEMDVAMYKSKQQRHSETEETGIA